MTMVGPQRLALDSPFRTPVGVAMSQQSQQPSPQLKMVTNPDSSIFAGYYIHKKALGEGGFGKVKLATHLKTNLKVAIKMMNKEKLGDDLERVYTEISALKQLKHENIAKLLQVIETSTDIYLVLEYCSGGELFDYLVARKRLAETEVRTIMRDLFHALLYIHSKGFAHRDIKPENILMDDKRKIKLIDFGLAANLATNKFKFLETCCGSPAYAAPELLLGLKYSGPAIDVWSSGVLFYSLLTGRLPFEDENLQILYRKIQSGKYERPLYLSIDVLDLMAQMLKTNPSQRITVSRALQHRWFKKNSIGEIMNDVKTVPVAQPDQLDLEALRCCALLFPQHDHDKLKTVVNDYGYVTATYLLLKHNPDAVQGVKTSFADKGRLFSMVDGGPKDMSPLNQRATPLKRKLNFEPGQSESNSPTIPTKRYNAATVRPPSKLAAPSIPQRAVHTIGTPTRVGNPIVAKRIVSPRMIKNCENVENRHTPQKTPGTPVNTMKSPLRVINQVLTSPPQHTPKPTGTPLSKPPSTTKMSILKRLLGSATPSRTQQPRKLSGTSSNQITMTPYQDPQECMTQLIDNLKQKGVECKQNNFVLKCYLNDKIHSSLKFELEICEVNGLCVIHRKRLKGDSWNYKKICEIILQLSNEKQVELLNKAKLSTPAGKTTRRSISYSHMQPL